MKPEEITKRVTDTLNFSFDRLDSARLGALNELKAFQEKKSGALKKGKVRLTEKLGPDHPKVNAVGEKIRSIENRSNDLDVLIAEAKVEAALPDENTWQVHGKVIDKDRKGIEGVTTALYDEEGRWVRETGYGCTDSQGYFSISYSVDDTPTPKLPPDKKLYLYLLNKKNEILYKDSVALSANPGKIAYRTVYLSGKDDPCTPPKPGEGGTEPPLPKGKWVVRGRAADENGGGLGGLTVKISDREGVFGDRFESVPTKRDGTFIAEYRAEDFRDVIEADPELQLKVLDKEGRTLFSSRKKFKFQAGGVETFRIKIKKIRRQ